jgi:DNA-binding NtrC family response regulator
VPANIEMTLDDALGHAEKQIILEALERFKWNRQMSAQALGISRTTLFNKMKRFKLMEHRRQTTGRKPGAKPASRTAHLQ